MGRPAVVYLSRYGNPPWLARGFVGSLRRFSPGADVELIVLLKGYPPSQGDPILNPSTDGIASRVTELRIPDEGFSIDSYMRAAEALTDFRQLLFLTSYSRILADRWLSAYLAAFDAAPDCGAVSATGSYEAAAGAGFPNPHLRTNAFMIDRSLLLGLERGSLVTKSGNASFEAGPNGLTVQLRRRGLHPVVVDRAGSLWPIERWRDSRTFRTGEQENLLIADNRTHEYASGSQKHRRKLVRQAWGDAVDVPRLGFIERQRRRWAWRYPARAPAAEP